MTLKEIESKYKKKNDLFGIIGNLVRVKVYEDDDKKHKGVVLESKLYEIGKGK